MGNATARGGGRVAARGGAVARHDRVATRRVVAS
jgi:hypothetical protein